MGLTCTTVHSLTVADFYKDTNAEILAKTNSSNAYSLPIHISNLKYFVTVSSYYVSQYCLQYS